MNRSEHHHGRPGALSPAALLLLALCLLAGSAQALDDAATAASAPPGYETPIVTNAADQIAPAVYGSRVVWQDWRNNAIGDAMWDIYSYDTASHLELPEGASISGYGKYVPNDRDAAISARGIFWVWAGRSDADVNNHILGRTLDSDPTNVSVEQEGSYWNILDLDADGDTLVGVVYNGYSYRILEYWWAHGRDGYSYLRETTNEIRSPKVSGTTVVWQEYDGNDWNVFAQNLSQGRTIALGNNPASDEVSPTVSGTRAVWADNRSGTWDLWTADLSQPDPVGAAWLVAPGDQAEPSLDGDRLAWQDDRAGDWDIWLGSISGGGGAPIADAAGDQQAPDVDGDRIVWQDRRGGNWDIYEFTVSPTTPAPAPTPAPLVITAPGTYSVGADGWDGSTTPVEIRASDVVLDGGNHVLDGTGRPESCGVLVAGDGALSNVVVRNLRLTNWETGIMIENAADSEIEGCDVEHNRIGVVLDDTRSTAVRDSRIRANDDAGVWIPRSANATLSGNDVTRTGDGFQHLLSTTMDLSTFAVVVANSDGTVITGNDLGGDFGSLNIAGSTATRVTGNQVTGDRVGIFSLSRSEGATIFDNVFRNSRYAYGAPENATWNATPSPGPNIVGGPTIGGNFWAKPDGTGFSETHPDANRDGFVDTPFIDTTWPGVSDYLPLAPWNGPAPGPTPYKPLSVPGRIEAEDYDQGGEGVAYHDTTAGNSGGAYRNDDVDIETAGGITNLGWIRTGEWLTYTVNVTQAGDYRASLRVASPNTGRSVEIDIDGRPAFAITVPKTGSFEAYTTTGAFPNPSVTATVTPAGTGNDVAYAPVHLEAGTHTVRLLFIGDGQNLDWFELAPVDAAPNGTPFKPLAIPGTIQAEDYDLGGEGVAYHDTTPGNSGGAYRNDGVDIESAGSVTNVGWIRNNEWLAYTVNVTTNGTYTIMAMVASPNAGRSIAVSVDGNAAATIVVPNTGSFAAFQGVEAPIALPAGTHTLKFAFAGDGQNLDRIVFTAPSTIPCVHADAYPMPNFTADRTNGTAPLTVRFTDTSSEWAYDWRWTFGDGGTSTEKNPIHTFTAPGVYQVGLTIKEQDHVEGCTFIHYWNDLPSPYPPKTVNVTVEGTGPATGHTVPGRIQAEDYDSGGEGVAYHDTTPGNSGGAYRHDDVDIESARGLTNIGWIRNGEWLSYTVTVPVAGTYRLNANVAAPNSGRAIAVSLDGTPVGTIAVPNTGSFERFTTVSTGIELPAGVHTVRLGFSGDGQNLDWIECSQGPVTTPAPEPSAGASFVASPTSAPRGSAVRFALTPASGKAIASAWWSFDAPAHLNTWNSQAINPTFYYPSAGTFSPLVRLTYADGTTETVQRTSYIRAT